MPEKNLRLQKRLEEFNRLVDQSIAELRGIKVKARRVREKLASNLLNFIKCSPVLRRPVGG